MAAPDFEDNFRELKERLQVVFNADPDQYHNDFSIKRYLRAFINVDCAFQSVLKSNKWNAEYGVKNISEDDPDIRSYLDSKMAVVLRHKDRTGRPVIYIPVRNHNVNERDIDKATRFIVYTLEKACAKCFEEVTDTLCIVFDLKDFGLSCMDYQLVKNMIWLLSRHYPERLGVCLLINAPTLFAGCWPIIKKWLHESTASKVVFINNTAELMNYIHPDILPEE